ncbi:DUF1090 family protein [Halomonas litopenaei]|uniref:DUF1090 family protein n=1 Tax=Halomonas litopenaei TaxID=2109328 RepID=UPI003FA0EB46
MPFNRHTLLLTPVWLLLSTLAMADGARDSCDQRAQALEHDLAFARHAEDTARVNELELALDGVRSGCTSEDVLSEAESRVREGQQVVEQRQQELNEAFDEGDIGQITRKREALEVAIEMLNARIAALKVLLPSAS